MEGPAQMWTSVTKTMVVVPTFVIILQAVSIANVQKVII
jgi:hypothetical protein